MHYQSLILAAFAASTFANPITLKKRDEKTWDENGNIKLTFSEQTVTIGTIELDEIGAKLGEVCRESGQCQTNDITMEGQVLTKETAENIELTLGPAGAYPTWIRNGLLDGLMAAVKEIAKCEEITHDAPCPNPMVFCPNEPEKVTQCEVPKYWGINWQDPEASNAAPPHMEADLEVQVTDSTICADTLESLGAIAGAISGIAGGAFTLLTFACEA